MDAKRIVREIRLLRHFNHENVIKVVDILPPSSLEDFDVRQLQPIFAILIVHACRLTLRGNPDAAYGICRRNHYVRKGRYHDKHRRGGLYILHDPKMSRQVASGALVPQHSPVVLAVVERKKWQPFRHMRHYPHLCVPHG